MKKIKLFTIAALMMGLVSCQKEESNDRKDGNTPAPTKKEMLTAKTWTLTAMTIDPAMMGVTDIYPMIDACQKDNTWKFGTDGRTLTIDEGSNTCKGHDQTTTTSWSLNDAGTTLTIDSYHYEVRDITADGFKMLESMVDNGKTYTITSTYSAK